MIQELLPLAKNTPLEELINIQSINKGVYILVDTNGNIISEHIKNSPQEEKGIWEDEFKAKVFYSKVLNSNKNIVPRKPISSNNPYSFIVWQSNFLDNSYIELIDLYFEKQKEYNSHLDLNKYKEILLKVTTYVKNNIYNYFYQINEKTKEKTIKDPNKNKIHIFINVSNEEYDICFMNYLKKKLFVDNKYNIVVNEETIGVPALNNAYDGNKPYIKHLTQPNQISYQCSFIDAFNIYKLYNWIINQILLNNINQNNAILKIKMDNPILTLAKENDNKYFLLKGNIKRSVQGTEFLVEDFQIICNDKKNINFQKIQFLETDYELPNIKNFKEFENFINDCLYNKKFYDKDIKVTEKMSSQLVSYLIQYKKILENCFKYADLSILTKKFKDIFSNISFAYAKIGIKNNQEENLYLYKIAIILTTLYNMVAIEELNIKGGKDMQNRMYNMLDTIREKINSDNVTPISENIDEYCFAIGQLTRYLVSQSKAQKKTFKLADPVLSCTKKQKLDTIIQNMLSQYSHSLQLSKKLNNLIAMTTSVAFEDEKLNRDMILAGFVANNLLYEKNKDENVEVNNNEKN